MQPTGFLRATLLRRQAGGLGRWRCKSSLAEVTARVLSEGKANSTTGHGAFPGPSLSTLEELTASMPPQPVSILMLTSWARVTKPEGRLLQAKFIRNELIARRAHILTLLHSMPEPLGNQPALASWVNVYWERLRDLLERPEPQTHEEERIFAELCKERNAQIGSIGTAAEETMLVEALQRVQQERGSEWWATHPEERHAVDRHLDAIFLARIGLRFLLEFHVACDTPREGFAGGTGDAMLSGRSAPVPRHRRPIGSDGGARGRAADRGGGRRFADLHVCALAHRLRRRYPTHKLLRRHASTPPSAAGGGPHCARGTAPPCQSNRGSER